MQTVTSSTNQGPAFASVAKAACGLIEAGWNSDRAAIESFLLSLAVYVRECLEHVNSFTPTIQFYRCRVAYKML